MHWIFFFFLRFALILIWVAFCLSISISFRQFFFFFFSSLVLLLFFLLCEVRFCCCCCWMLHRVLQQYVERSLAQAENNETSIHWRPTKHNFSHFYFCEDDDDDDGSFWNRYSRSLFCHLYSLSVVASHCVHKWRCTMGIRHLSMCTYVYRGIDIKFCRRNETADPNRRNIFDEKCFVFVLCAYIFWCWVQICVCFFFSASFSSHPFSRLFFISTWNFIKFFFYIFCCFIRSRRFHRRNIKKKKKWITTCDVI